ncbi:MAG: DUF5011 domain-containing protein [Bacilli bacterium]|nr:DUF5011 domain-containing protein [Bacilli bacterium]
MLKNKKGILYIAIGIVVLVVVIVSIISFKGNDRKPPEEPITYHMELNGEQEIIVYQNSLYEDMGCKVLDNKGNEYTDNVLVSGSVNTSIVGKYDLIYTYDEFGLSATRTVNVISKPTNLTYLLLNGDSVIYLPKGKTYEEPGYYVFDSNNIDLVNEVKVTGTVDITKSGTYTLVYSVTNSSGVTVSATREVIVVGATVNVSYSPNSTTNKDVTINISVEDNYFDYILLPDGKKVSESNYNYSVSSNGTYEFTVYSKYGDPVSESIKINNIDKSKPSGSCSGYYKNNTSYITISAKDNIGINKYTVNGKTVSLKDGIYVHNSSLANAKVVVYDKAGNSSSFSCALENKNDFSSGTSLAGEMNVYQYVTSKNIKMSYWLYVPKNPPKNLPVVVFLHGGGEGGNDYKNGKMSGIVYGIGNDIKNYGSVYDAIVIMPQSPKWSWIEDANMLAGAMEIINYIVDKYNADSNRISISAFSNGCESLNLVVKRYPNYFSAYVPIECILFSSSVPYMINAPVWSFNSQKVNHQGSVKFINKLNEAGGNGKEYYMNVESHVALVGGKKDFSIFRDKEIDLVNWMTSQKRK